MNKDYMYCDNNNCIHRRGCKRWIGNYQHLKAGIIGIENPEIYCVNGQLPYAMLDRFRNSNEEGFIYES